jgi:hypothetical protein
VDKGCITKGFTCSPLTNIVPINPACDEEEEESFEKYTKDELRLVIRKKTNCQKFYLKI